MEFEHSDKVKPLQEKLRRFMDEHIYPNERRLRRGDRGEHAAGAALDAARS